MGGLAVPPWYIGSVMTWWRALAAVQNVFPLFLFVSCCKPIAPLGDIYLLGLRGRLRWSTTCFKRQLGFPSCAVGLERASESQYRISATYIIRVHHF